MRAIVAALAIFFSPQLASGQTIGIFADIQGGDPRIVDGGPGLIELHVVTFSLQGLTATQFSAPLPDCFTGATHLSDFSPFTVSIGNSQEGWAISFGACATGPTYVGTINVFASGQTQGFCIYDVLPDPNVSSGRIEFVDCASQLVFGRGLSGCINDPQTVGGVTVSDPTPVDGAFNQPLDTQLRWNLTACFAGLGVQWGDVYFGTNPDPPLVASQVGFPYDPGQLVPETTYYWKIFGVDTDNGSSFSPVWSFKTAPIVSTKEASWGAIKATFED